MTTGIILELSDVTAIIDGFACVPTFNKLKERFDLATKNNL